jgi:hypothetical protein
VIGTAALTAFVAYADSVAGGLAVVPAQTTPRTGLMFAHIADLPPWLTGLALLNTTSANATVSVYAMTPAGTLIGGADNVPTARFTLNAGAKTAKLLSELIPQTQQRTSDGGFIFISSTQPLYGIELFFTRNLRILANVAAGAAGSFTPPGGGGGSPVSLTSVSPTRAAVGSTITLTGSGFSTTAASNSVVFTRASGTVSVPAATATSTTLTVAVPTDAITGPVIVQSGGQSSSAVILEVIASPITLLPGGVVTVAGGATTSGVDLYVPPLAGSLNVLIIGLGELNGGSIRLTGSSVDITRGQSKLLVVAGDGVSPSNGSQLALSGDGVTIGTTEFQSGFAFAVITVAQNAPTGARNVIVTNTNLDRSVLSGGLFVR